MLDCNHKRNKSKDSIMLTERDFVKSQLVDSSKQREIDAINRNPSLHTGVLFYLFRKLGGGKTVLSVLLAFLLMSLANMINNVKITVVPSNPDSNTQLVINTK